MRSFIFVLSYSSQLVEHTLLLRSKETKNSYLWIWCREHVVNDRTGRSEERTLLHISLHLLIDHQHSWILHQLLLSFPLFLRRLFSKIDSMLLIRSPSILFALIFSFISLVLTILTFHIGYNHPQNQIQFLIILPPLNTIFLFLLSLTWLERRFRLSYIPFICLILLLLSSTTLAIISSHFFSSSIIIYLNFIFYSFCTILFFSLISTLIILYLCGSLFIHRRRYLMTEEQQNDRISKTIPSIWQMNSLILKSNEKEFFLYMSKLPGRRVRHDIRNIHDDLQEISVDTILTLNETKELSIMNMTNNNPFNMDIFATQIKRANTEHLIYPIRNHFIPKSISDYMQFLYTIIYNFNQANQQRLLIHCLNGLGRTGMTVVCFEILYEYIANENNERNEKQKFLERICHYPFFFTHSCRVCQAINQVNTIRPKCLSNPLQIFFVHEFYARLKSSPYMEQMKDIINRQERSLLNILDEFRSPMII